MFTIQYEAVNGEHKLRAFDHSQTLLIIYLASFECPIVAVYEHTTPITKRIREELKKWPGSLTRCAREFAFMLPV